MGFGDNATNTKGSVRRYIPKIDTEFRTDFFYLDKIELTIIAQNRFKLKMSIFSRIISKIQTLLGV
jgi:hypothetical protein